MIMTKLVNTGVRTAEITYHISTPKLYCRTAATLKHNSPAHASAGTRTIAGLFAGWLENEGVVSVVVARGPLAPFHRTAVTSVVLIEVLANVVQRTRCPLEHPTRPAFGLPPLHHLYVLDHAEVAGLGGVYLEASKETFARQAFWRRSQGLELQRRRRRAFILEHSIFGVN